MDLDNYGFGSDKLANESSNESDKLDAYGDEFLKDGIIPLLCELLAQDKLPAILFYVDEKGCVELAWIKWSRQRKKGQKENQRCEKMSMKKNPSHYPKR